MAGLFLGIVLLALAFWMIARQQKQRRDRAALRLSLTQIRLLRQLIEQVQRHRGLYYGVLSGEASLEGRRWSVHQQINQVLAGCREHLPSLHWYDSWHEALGYWERIEQGEFQACADQMLLAHNDMIRLLLETVQALANRNDLVCLGRLAPQAEGLWLELLHNTEIVGQSRAIGTGIVANRQNLPTWRAHLASLSAQINEQCYAALARLVSDPELRDSVSQPVRVAEEALDALLERIRELLDRPDSSGMKSADYFQTATQALSAQLVLVDMLLDRLEQRAIRAD